MTQLWFKNPGIHLKLAAELGNVIHMVTDFEEQCKIGAEGYAKQMKPGNVSQGQSTCRETLRGHCMKQ